MPIEIPNELRPVASILGGVEWRTAEFFGLPARAEHDLDNAITLGEVAHLQELAKTHPGYGTVPAARLLSDISTELTGHADPYHLLLRYREAWIESGTPTSLADLAPRTPEAGTGWGSWDRSDPAEYMTRNYWGYWEDGRWQGDSFSPPRFVEGTYVHDTLIIPKVHEAMAKLGIEIRSIDNVHEFAGANLYPGMAIMPFVKSGEGRYIAFTYTGSPKEHQVWRAAAGDGTYRYRDSHGIPRSMHLPTVFSEHQKVIADSGARHFPGTPDAFRNTVHTLSVSADIREGDGFDYAPASPGAVTAPAVQRKRWAVEAYVFESVSSEPKVEWQGTEAVVNAAEHGFVSYRMSNTPGHDNASYFMGDQSFPKTPLYRERWANFLDGHPRVKAWREVVSLDGDLPPGVRSVSIGEDGLAAYVVTLYDHPELLGRTYTWAHPERIAHDGIPPGAPGDPPTPPPSGALAYPSGNVDSATAKSVVIAQLSTLLPGRSPELIGASHNVMRALVTQAKPGTDPVAPTVRVVYGPGGPRVRIEVPGIGELPQLAAFRPFRSGIVVDDDRRMSGWAEVAAAPGAARDIGADLARGQGHEIRAASAGRVQADPATAIRNHLRDVLGPDRSRRQDAIGLGAVAAEWAAASSDGRIGVRVESTNERIRVAVDVTVLMSGTHNRTADAAFLASAMYTANASGIDLQPLSGRVVRKTLWFELNGRAAGPSTDPTSGSDTPAPPSR
ncbi:MAG: hypothetical protein HOQ24_14800 [Mycobacteriaceae bacterium]|nr:hypothetical protein [Mycobacteriaceae bacterium]